jgi:hypothetical protein
VGPAVFNTDVIEYLGQAGSIPVRLRQPAQLVVLKLRGELRSLDAVSGSAALTEAVNNEDRQVARLSAKRLDIHGGSSASLIIAALADHGAAADKRSRGRLAGA